MDNSEHFTTDYEVVSRSSFLMHHRRGDFDAKAFLELVLNQIPRRKRLYYLACLTFLALFFLSLVITDLHTLHLYLTSFDNDTFMDFFNMLAANIEEFRASRYETQTIYPPLANAIYLFLASLLSPLSQYRLSHAVNKDELFLQEPLMLFVIYLLVTHLMLIIALWNLKKGKPWERWLFVGIFLSSVPMLYLYERANNIIIALDFTLLFFCLKDSKHAFAREIALISLALAAGIKLYPAIFGFLLVREGRLRDSVRLLIYGILTIVLPFLCFNGISDLVTYISNLINGSGALSIGREGFRLNYDAQFAFFLSEWPWLIEPVSKAFLFFSIAGTALSTVFAASPWKVILLYTCLLMGIPSVSYEYAAVFLVIPLALSLDDDTSWNAFDYAYLILMVAVLMPVSLFWFEGAGQTYYSSMLRTIPANIAGCSVIALTVLGIVDSCFVSNRLMTSSGMTIDVSSRFAGIPVGLLAIPMLISVVFGYYSGAGAPYYVSNYIRYTMNDIILMGSGDYIRQSFVSNGSQVDAIAIRLGTFDDGELTVRLLDSGGNELCSSTRSSTQLVPSTVNAFYFDDPVNVETDSLYTLEVSWLGEYPDDYLLAFHSVPEYGNRVEDGYIFSVGLNTVLDWDYCLSFAVIQER